MWRQFLNNQRGLTLMEMVVSAVLTGLLGLLILQQFKEQDKFKRSMETDTTVTELRRGFLKGFQNPQACANTLRQGPPGASFIPGSIPILSLRNAGPNGGSEMYRVNVPFDGDKFVIRDIATAFNQLSGILTVTVRVQDVRKSPNGLFTAMGQRRMLPPIEFEVDVTQEPNTNFFVECSADSPDSLKFCTGPGAIYDAITDECTIIGPNLISPAFPVTWGSKGVSLDFSTGEVNLVPFIPIPGGIDCRSPGQYLELAGGVHQCATFQWGHVQHLFDLNPKNCSGNTLVQIKYNSTTKKYEIFCEPNSCTPVDCVETYTDMGCQTLPTGCKTGCRIYEYVVTTPESCGGNPCTPYSHCTNDPTCTETNTACLHW